MAPLTDDLSSIPLSLASCSIGLPRHTFHQKIEAISHSGFKGIELSLPDLPALARELKSLGQLSREDHKESGDETTSPKDDDDDIAEDDWPTLCAAASHARTLCETHNLTIIVLQPFANYEGWTDPETRSQVLARARGWARIMRAAGTDMLQVGSTDTPAHKITADREALAADLAKLADLLREVDPHFRIAYENWCWATRAPSWRDVWEIVKLVDRHNVGLCLDTFQSAGGEWGDPTTASGLVEQKGSEQGDVAVSRDEVQSSWRASLRELVCEVPAKKIFFLQISDAYRMETPMEARPEPDDETGLRPRGRWSHDYRPLPYDGGYLPIADFTRAVLETGFRGWLSVEVFDGEFEKKYGDDLFGYAQKARDTTRRLVEEAAAMESL